MSTHRCKVSVIFTKMISEQSKLVWNRKKTNDLYIKVYSCSATIFSYVVPFVVSILLMVKQQTPPFMGWLLWRSDDESVLKAGLLSFVNWIMLSGLIAANVFGIVYGTLLKLYALFVHIRLLSQQSNCRKFVPFISTQTIESNISIYRQVQLLAIMYNECYQWIFFTWILLLLYFMMSVNVYAFVKFHSEISLMDCFILTNSSVQGFVFVIILGSVAGQLYFSSRQIPRVWMRNPSVYRNLRLRNKLRSCSGIKIRIGSVNFVDRLTPFSTCSLCLKVTVRLLMAS
jgi:hypothetical protein